MKKKKEIRIRFSLTGTYGEKEEKFESVFY